MRPFVSHSTPFKSRKSEKRGAIKTPAHSPLAGTVGRGERNTSLTREFSRRTRARNTRTRLWSVRTHHKQAPRPHTHGQRRLCEPLTRLHGTAAKETRQKMNAPPGTHRPPQKTTPNKTTQSTPPKESALRLCFATESGLTTRPSTDERAARATRPNKPQPLTPHTHPTQSGNKNRSKAPY